MTALPKDLLDNIHCSLWMSSLLMYFLTWTKETPPGLWYFIFLKASLVSKDFGKDTIQKFSLFHALELCNQVPHLIEQWTHIFHRPFIFLLCHPCTYKYPSSCLWHPWTEVIPCGLQLS